MIASAALRFSLFILSLLKLLYYTLLPDYCQYYTFFGKFMQVFHKILIKIDKKFVDKG